MVCYLKNPTLPMPAVCNTWIPSETKLHSYPPVFAQPKIKLLHQILVRHGSPTWTAALVSNRTMDTGNVLQQIVVHFAVQTAAVTQCTWTVLRPCHIRLQYL